MEVCKTQDYTKAEEFVEKFMMEAYSTTQVCSFHRVMASQEKL